MWVASHLNLNPLIFKTSLGNQEKMRVLVILNLPEIDNLIPPRSYVDEHNVQQDIVYVTSDIGKKINPD